MPGRTLCLLLLFFLAPSASADELRLKDGTRIVGTIVGFEDNSFKVQTSYGYALVRKDKVAMILPSERKEEATAASKKTSAPAVVASAPQPHEEAAAASKKTSAPAIAAAAPQPHEKTTDAKKTSAPAIPASAPQPHEKTADASKKTSAPAVAASAPQPPEEAAAASKKTSAPAIAASAPQPHEKTAAASKKTSAPAIAASAPQPHEKTAAAKKTSAPAIAASASQPHVAAPAPTPKKAPLRPAAPTPATHAVEQAKLPSATESNPPSPAAHSVSAALAITTPVAATPQPVIREEVQGNLYINHTYGFRMYKPPGWHIIEEAQKTLPTAVVAMGTSDETTLLVVGREPMKDSLESHVVAIERQLREIYENYRRLSERRSRIAGLPALERRYRGAAEGHDWSGVMLSFARGNEVFTILGMTYADSDLIQIQENVIAKTIASLEFLSR